MAVLSPLLQGDKIRRALELKIHELRNESFRSYSTDDTEDISPLLLIHDAIKNEGNIDILIEHHGLGNPQIADILCRHSIITEKRKSCVQSGCMSLSRPFTPRKFMKIN